MVVKFLSNFTTNVLFKTVKNLTMGEGERLDKK